MRGDRDPDAELWVFGYGSLIWRPAFAHEARQAARLSGYERRFCQASHDHRGTPERPGRVVTLLPVAGSDCHGMAYKLPHPGRKEILAYLDHREQDGYERLYAPLHVGEGQTVPGLTWIANDANPSWRAGETLEEVALLIAERHGPSGSNREYLYELEQALAALDMPDPHVSALSYRVRQLAAGG
ncbi:gamma-glutamylcyclotransferase [Granulosicoccus sp. 3-233]|uniref:gamma-glutamylcyclotransferase n=1 Tax=Granulosicoccus sp. 3-233 TaxID=3417969 RepID=UPI003D358E27